MGISGVQHSDPQFLKVTPVIVIKYQLYFLCYTICPHSFFILYIVGESESFLVVSNSLWPLGLYSPWNSPGQNTGVGSLSLLQRIFPTQESNWCLLHCRQILYQLSYQRSPYIVVQFSSVSQSCLTLCNPMNCSTPDLPIHHQLLESTQTHAHWIGDAIQPSHPLSSLPLSGPFPFPSPHW